MLVGVGEVCVETDPSTSSVTITDSVKVTDEVDACVKPHPTRKMVKAARKVILASFEENGIISALYVLHG